jgi:hypothetical protein
VNNNFLEMRKQLDHRIDISIHELRTDVTNGENRIREDLRYILVGSVRKRLFGAAILAAGIVLEIAGAIVGSL